jgi:hypothetical protein
MKLEHAQSPMKSGQSKRHLHLPQVLHQVVGERIIVVDDQRDIQGKKGAEERKIESANLRAPAPARSGYFQKLCRIFQPTGV